MSEKVNYDELMDKEDPDIKVEMPSIDANDSILIIEKGALRSGQPFKRTERYVSRSLDGSKVAPGETIATL